MNLKKIILLILIFVSPAKNIHSMNFLKRNYKTVIGLGVSAYLLYKYFKKDKTNIIDTTPTNHLSHTPATENFLHRTLESNSLQPNVLNSQGLTEEIRDNILSNLTKYSCLKNFIYPEFVIESLCKLNNGNLAISLDYKPDVLNAENMTRMLRLPSIIKIWNINTGKCIRTLKWHTNSINGITSLCVLPNGNLVSASYKINVWDINTGECLKTLVGHSASVNSLCILNNGNLVSASSDSIKIWNINTGECLRTLNDHTISIKSICLLPDGNLASSSYFANTIKIWDIFTGECLRTLVGHSAPVNSLCILNNGNLASASFDGTIKIWDINTNECIQTFEAQETFYASICVLKNGNLASSLYDGKIRIWNVKTGKCLQTLQSSAILLPPDIIFSLCALSNGMFASGYKGEIKIWGNKFDIKM